MVQNIAVAQHKYMTKLRRKYWLLKVIMCLQIPLFMAYTLWLGADMSNFNSLSSNTKEGLVIATAMTVLLFIAGTIVGMLKIEEVRLEIKKEEDEKL